MVQLVNFRSRTDTDRRREPNNYLQSTVRVQPSKNYNVKQQGLYSIKLDLTYYKHTKTEYHHKERLLIVESKEHSLRSAAICAHKYREICTDILWTLRNSGENIN